MFNEIQGLTKTVPPSKNDKEFTIHVQSEGDLRIKSENREQILEFIRKAYYNNKLENIPMYQV